MPTHVIVSPVRILRLYISYVVRGCVCLYLPACMCAYIKRVIKKKNELNRKEKITWKIEEENNFDKIAVGVSGSRSFSSVSVFFLFISKNKRRKIVYMVDIFTDC